VRAEGHDPKIRVGRAGPTFAATDNYQAATLSSMRRRVVLLASIAGAVTVVAAHAGSPTTVVSGTVLLDPAKPVCRVGNPCTKPLPHFKLVFWRGGAVVKRVETNDRARYRITLAPGVYRVTHPHSAAGAGLTPRRFSVPAASGATRSFRYDAGIR
jgi:hypothetical protein